MSNNKQLTAREYVKLHKRKGDLIKIAKITKYKYNSIRNWLTGTTLSREDDIVKAMRQLKEKREVKYS